MEKLYEDQNNNHHRDGYIFRNKFLRMPFASLSIFSEISFFLFFWRGGGGGGGGEVEEVGEGR